MPEPTDYNGPSRKPEDVIRAAFSDPDFVLQIISSYEEQLRGIPPTPLREIDARLKAKNRARHRSA